MKKLIQGIVDFRQHRIVEYRQKFAKLALGQSPDALFIACSDSRVVPNLFASTDPGDLFVIRNVGNLVPPCHVDGHSADGHSEWAAIEFAVLQLKVSDIIVCGHSECGAIDAMCRGREGTVGRHLPTWLRHAERALAWQSTITYPNASLSPQNQLSQANVLLQLEHLATAPLVAERCRDHRLQLHAWWFDIASGNVYTFDNTRRQYVLIGASHR